MKLSISDHVTIFGIFLGIDEFTPDTEFVEERPDQRSGLERAVWAMLDQKPVPNLGLDCPSRSVALLENCNIQTSLL